MTVVPSSPCIQCGCYPNPRAVNTTIHISTPAGPTILQMQNQRHPPDLPDYIALTDLCLSCSFTREKALASHILELIGVARRHSAVWVIECMPGYELGEEWRDFSTLMFGRQIGVVAASVDSHPFDTTAVPWGAHYRPTSGLVFVTQVWMRRVRYRDTSLYLEERWDPTLSAPRVSLLGLEGADRIGTAIGALRDGRNLLLKLDQGGREKGTTSYSEEELRTAAIKAWQEVKSRAITECRRPSKAELAVELAIGKTTLYDYLKRWPIDLA